MGKKVFLAIGIASMFSQIPILREVMVSCRGSELTIGVFLAYWLIFSSLGSYYSSQRERYVDVWKTILLVSLLNSVELLALRCIPKMTVPGAELPLLFQLTLPAVSAPTSFCLGLSFVEGLKFSRIKPREAYGYEALGFLIGGIALDFLLLGRTGHLFISSFLVALTALLLLEIKRKSLLFIVCLLLLMTLAYPIMLLDNFSVSLPLGKHEILEIWDSKYGRNSISEVGGEYSFYSNGVLLYTTGDEVCLELSYIPRLYREKLDRVLLIGRGLCNVANSMSEISEVVIYSELDPTIVKRGLKYIRLEDEVEIYSGDGREFLKKRSDKFDLILLGSSGPTSLRENRYYTEEFFLEVKERLERDGIIVLGLPYSEAYMDEKTRLVISLVVNTMRRVFEYVEFFPGSELYLIGSDSVLPSREEVLERSKLLKGEFDYYYVLKYLEEDRVQSVLSMIPSTEEVNEDFKPRAYYYYVMSWLRKFTSLTKETLIAIFLAFSIISAIIMRKMWSVQAFGMFSVGFSTMIHEIVVLLSFQSSFGYVYHKIGVIVSFFMLGIYLGSLIGERTRLEILILALFSYTLSLTYLLSLEVELLFPLMTLVSGFLTGAFFSRSCLEIEGVSEIGEIYSADLLGGCLGSLLPTLLLVPVIGVTWTLVLTSALVISPLLLMLSRD